MDIPPIDMSRIVFWYRPKPPIFSSNKFSIFLIFFFFLIELFQVKINKLAKPILVIYEISFRLDYANVLKRSMKLNFKLEQFKYHEIITSRIEGFKSCCLELKLFTPIFLLLKKVI